jgi:hypothetical protein
VDNLGTRRAVSGVASPDTRHPSPLRVTLYDMRGPNKPAGTYLMTGREVCDLLHIAKSTLALWRTTGQIKGVKPSRDWRYPADQPIIADALAAVERP